MPKSNTLIKICGLTSEEQAPEGFAFVGMPPENAKLSFEGSSYIFPN